MRPRPPLAGRTVRWPLLHRRHQLANSAIERAGVIPARAETIRSLARHVVNGTITFSACVEGRVTASVIKTLPGIGDWTAEYIAMRAFGEPDAFPSGDLVLRRAAGDCTARELDRKSEAWRPWRAYAVMLLWQEAKSAGDVGSNLHDKNSRSPHVGASHATSGKVKPGRPCPIVSGAVASS